LGLLAAAAPLPPGFDAAALAGLLGERPVDLVRCRAVALEVPAEADFVLEGFLYPVDTDWVVEGSNLAVEGSSGPAEPAVEAGPLVTRAGAYAPARHVGVMRVTAITQRGNPVFPALVPGDPPNEGLPDRPSDATDPAAAGASGDPGGGRLRPADIPARCVIGQSWRSANRIPARPGRWPMRYGAMPR